jgi:hypothetical protein
MSKSRSGKAIAIIQSNYIPWKGYFDIIASVDEFVIFDDVQFTRRDWRNRNKIVLDGRLHWLTIPVLSKGKFHEPIDSIMVAGRSWATAHWQTIRQAYRKAPHFSEFAAALEDLYHRAAALERLTDINELFLRELSALLALDTAFVRSDTVPHNAQSASERLIEICTARGATEYISGPAAQAYIDVALFEAAQVSLRYANYSGYPTYDQASREFEHGVSLIDVLMRCGPGARQHLRSMQNRDAFLDAP